MKSALFVRLSLAIGASLLAVTGSAQIATWNVEGVSSASYSSLSAGSLTLRLTSASLSLGSGLATSSASGTFGGSGFDGTSLSTAISGNDYLSIRLTASDGYSMSLSSISFNSGVATSVSNFNVALLSSATGYTSAGALRSFSFSTESAPAQSITLSGIPGLQNVTGNLELRLYGWRDSSGTSTFRIRNLTGNDLTIAGTTAAIPEPSTYAAIFGALALIVAIARRTKSHGLLP